MVCNENNNYIHEIIEEDRPLRTKSKSPFFYDKMVDERRHKSATPHQITTTISENYRHKSVTPQISKNTFPNSSSSNFRHPHLRKKWTSAFRVVQSITRFKNMPLKHVSFYFEKSGY